MPKVELTGCRVNNKAWSKVKTVGNQSKRKKQRKGSPVKRLVRCFILDDGAIVARLVLPFATLLKPFQLAINHSFFVD